jgi:hypothetical protein
MVRPVRGALIRRDGEKRRVARDKNEAHWGANA